MSFLADFKPWLGVFIAFFATFFWRFLGLILAQRISSNGLLMHWINAIAYSMVAGVLMVLLVNPTGILLSSSLSSRLLGLSCGVFTIFVTRNLLVAIVCGMGVFAFSARFQSDEILRFL